MMIDFLGLKKKLEFHDNRFLGIEKSIEIMRADIEIMKVDIGFIKTGLKTKVDIEDFSALERRVILLEAKMNKK